MILKRRFGILTVTSLLIAVVAVLGIVVANAAAADDARRHAAVGMSATC